MRPITQNNSSTFSTSDTNTTQKAHTQQTSPQRYDPPPVTKQYSNHQTPHTPHHQGTSNEQNKNILQVSPETQFQTTTSPTRQPTIPTMNTVHSSSNYTNTKYTTSFNYQHFSFHCIIQIYRF